MLEYKVKAAYLYNFTKFISWPDKERTSFTICILGEDPFGAIIDPIKQRKAAGKPINLLRLKSGEDLGQCQLLYVENEKGYAKELSQVVESGVLTVTSLDAVDSDTQHPFFAKHGGMVGFIIRGGKIKLQLKLSQLKKKELIVSAKLLELVELVKEEGDE